MAAENRIITVMQGTSSEWEDQVRTQESGEFGLSTDSRELKIGDGTSAFDDLPTLLEVENAAAIKAALEGNANLSGSNPGADEAALSTKQDALAADIVAALEGNTNLSGSNPVVDEESLSALLQHSKKISGGTPLMEESDYDGVSSA